MKKKYWKTLYNRALSLTLVTSMAASLCFVASVVPAVGAEEALEESHRHTFACYEHYELDCQEEHRENEHRMECYTHFGELECGLEEGEIHVHTEPECEQAAKVLVCERTDDEKVLEEVIEDEAGNLESEESGEDPSVSDADAGEDHEEILQDEEEGSGDSTAIKPEDSGNSGMNGENGGTDDSGKDSQEYPGSQEEDSAQSGAEKEEDGNGADQKESDASSEEDKTDDEEDSRLEENDKEGNNAGLEDAGNQESAEEDSAENKGTQNGDIVDSEEQGGNTADSEKEESKDTDLSQETGDDGAGFDSAADGGKDDSDKPAGEADMNAGGETESYVSFSSGRFMQGYAFFGGMDMRKLLRFDDIVIDVEEAEGDETGSGTGEAAEEEPEVRILDEEDEASDDMIVIDEDETEAKTGKDSAETESGFDEIEETEEMSDQESAEETLTVLESEDAEDAVKIEIEDKDVPPHEHTEDCYVTVYRCRKAVPMALQAGNVTNQAELEKAIADGTEIVIANDFSIGSTVLIGNGKNVSIDLNGHVLTYDGSRNPGLGTSMFKVEQGGRLTVKDAQSSGKTPAPVKKGIAQTPGNVEYNENTGELTYYVTECEVNLDKRSTTNTTWEYSVNLNGSAAGTLDGQGIYSVILVEGGTLNFENGRISNADGWHGIAAKLGADGRACTVNMSGGYIVDSGVTSASGTLPSGLDLYGGGIRIAGGSLTISGGVIANNSGRQGGGIYASNWATVSLNGGIIANNTAGFNGGGIYSHTSKLNSQGSAVIVNNLANEGGGGVFFYGGNSNTSAAIRFDFSGGSIVGNKALKDGGGIQFFETNPAEVPGSENNGNRLYRNAVVCNNSAQEGGGVSIKGSMAAIGGKTVIAANKANASGGGIHNAGTDSTGSNLPMKKITIGEDSIIAANAAGNTGSESIYPYEYHIPDTNNTNAFIIGQDCYVENIWYDTEGGTARSYDDLKSMIEQASTHVQNHLETTVITLGEDISMANQQPLTIDEGRNIALDLNGKNIDGSGIQAGPENKRHLIYVTGEDSCLTIRDRAAGEDPAPQKTQVNVNLPDEAGKGGTYTADPSMRLTYYVTESTPNEIYTREQTYQYVISPKDRGGKPIGSIDGAGIDAVLSASGSARITIEGGIITNPGGKHGIYVENQSAFCMKGGYIIDSGDNTSKGRTDYVTGGGGVMAKNSGVEILNGVIAANRAQRDGGGIMAENGNGSRICIAGGVIAGNTANNRGGGLYIKGGSAEICGDAVIAGNLALADPRTPDGEADQNGSSAWSGEPSPHYHGGGGVFFEGGTLEIGEGCYITHNRMSRYEESLIGHGGTGGGGVFAKGKLRVAGGYITANLSEAAGGGMYSHSQSGSPGVLEITGGIIAGNYAVHEEGGGLRTDGQGGSISISDDDGRIYITNNKTGTVKAWGGGGLFVMSSAELNIKNVLITENKAEGFGGGVGGCNHGTNRLFRLNGGAIYGNTANGRGDKLKGYESQPLPKHKYKNDADRIDAKTIVMHENGSTKFADYFCDDGKKSYQDFYCSNISQVYELMLGGGKAHWQGCYSNSSKTDAENVPIAYPLPEIVEGEPASASNLMGLNANPTQEDIMKAKKVAKIFITGNYSAANGGGVMSNGTFGIGNNPGGDDGLKITKRVQLADGTTVSDDDTQFTFIVKWMGINGESLGSSEEYLATKEPVRAGETSKVTVRNGAEVTLRNGQSLIIHGLPIGEYEVKEQETDGYYVKSPSGGTANGPIWKNDQSEVTFINVIGEEPTKPEDPEEPTHPSTEPENPPTKPGNPEEPTGPSTEPGDPEKPTEPTESSPSEPTTSPEDPTSPVKPPSNGGGGSGGGGGRDPQDPTSPSPTEPSAETPEETASEPAEEVPEQPAEQPQYPTQLPDPNAPDSPDSITILEDGVPTTYLKVWDPEAEEFMYLPEDEVPLAFMLPKAGDTSKPFLWIMICGVSLLGMAALVWLRRRENDKEEENKKKVSSNREDTKRLL